MLRHEAQTLAMNATSSQQILSPERSLGLAASNWEDLLKARIAAPRLLCRLPLKAPILLVKRRS